MTTATPTMSFLTREQTPAPAADAAGATAARSGADEDARRLAGAVARGDEAAFRQLYDAYQARLFRFALVLGHGDEWLAHETVQSVFLTAAAKLRLVMGEDHLSNWLARVARQHLAKHWRQQGREPAMVNVADLPNTVATGRSEALLEESLDAALLELEPEDRRLIERFYLDGRSQKEVAGELNLTAKAVSSRLERARARLRALVAKRLAHET